jgi:hypothetical protein
MPRPRTSTPRDPELATLAAAIQARIDANPDLTQTAVAGRAGLETKQVNSYVCGRVEPTFRNFRRLARGLGVKASELMAAIESIESIAAGEEDCESACEEFTCGVH